MKSNNAGVVELIDRALNKGVILNADLVVTVADVPLLAVNLKLALANVETMLKYGMMEDWLKPLSLDEKKMTPVNYRQNHLLSSVTDDETLTIIKKEESR